MVHASETGPAMLTADDHGRVSTAITAAESRSDGEIATIIARQSDSYADWALLLSVAGSFVLTAIGWPWAAMLAERAMHLAGRWDVAPGPADIWLAACAMQIMLLAGIWLLLQWPALRMMLVPRGMKRRRVRAAAVQAYRIGLEARTRAATGALIYLSQAEHGVEIVGDAAINRHIATEDWAEPMEMLLTALQGGRAAEGIIDAVEHIGAMMARHFPRSADGRR
jgi:putative membrane protein